MAITAMPAAAHVRANLKICFRSIMSSLREDRPEGLYYTYCRPGHGRLRSPSLSHLTARVAPNPAGMAIMIHTFRVSRFNAPPRHARSDRHVHRDAERST